jgi:hypothetical protein
MANVYLHKRLDTNEIFYVGIGNSVKRAFDKNSRNQYWNNIVNKTDYTVEIYAENLDWESACRLEKKLILQYGRKDLGLGTLCNLTNGGDGVIGHSKESIEKIRKAHLGREHSEQERRNRSNSLKGKKRSAETKKNMSKARIGIKFSESHIQNLSNSHKGNVSSNAKNTIDLLTGYCFDSLRLACLSLNLKYKTEHAKMKRNTNQRFIYL